MDNIDKIIDTWKHHPQNHIVKGGVFLFTGLIGIATVIILFYAPHIQPRRSDKVVPPTHVSPPPSVDIPVDTQFSTYNDQTLKAQFSYPSTWVTKTEGDTKDWRVIVSDQQAPYFGVQFRRIENHIYSVDEYIRVRFRQFTDIQVSTYDVSGIHYLIVTGDPGVTMYYLYTSEDNAIYEIAVMSAVKDKSNPSTARNLKLAEMTVRSFIFQSSLDTTKIKVDLQQIRAALEMYLVDYGSYPENLSQLEPKYIPVLPHNPYAFYHYDYESYNVITPTYTIKTFLPDGTEYVVNNP